MARRNEIRIETNLGAAVAVPQSDAFEEEWLISTPWGDRRFYGTPGEVRREMEQMIRLNDGEEEVTE
jgi:hypothetical protein